MLLNNIVLCDIISIVRERNRPLLKGSEEMKMPTPTEICVELARENERLKIEIERLKARIAELEKAHK